MPAIPQQNPLGDTDRRNRSTEPSGGTDRRNRPAEPSGGTDQRNPSAEPFGGTPEHYSYSVYADPAMAEKFDAMRFSGPIGTLVAEAQERVLFEFLGDVSGLSVLDVGTGTGRAALALAERGAHVRGVDAAAEMLAVARRRADAAGVKVEFVTGDAHALALDDCSMDAAVSLRVLMHTPDWQKCVGELCRVTQRSIVIDFPAAASLALLHSLARRWRLARDREAYRVFSLGEIRDAFAAHGFHVTRVHRQFVLPIALHKALGSRRFTTASETALAALGLLRLVGSPVTVLAERTGKSGARS